MNEMKFAADVANKVIFLDQGNIEAQGTPDQIFRSPSSERLKQFIGSIT